jgi:serine/threonine-protein kinase
MKVPRFVLKDWFIGVVLTSIVLVAYTFELYPLKAIDYKAYDFLSRFVSRDEPSDIVLVAIDEKSLRELGASPLPRAYLANVVAYLSSNGARAIGIDVLYAEKERNPGLDEIRRIVNDFEKKPKRSKNKVLSGLHRSLKDAAQSIDGDARLVESVRAGRNMILPISFSMSAAGEPGGQDANMPTILQKKSVELPEYDIDPKEALFALHNPLALHINPPPEASDVEYPFSALARAALSFGHVNHLPDEDGILRREPLFIRYHGRSFPSLALQLAMSFAGSRLRDLEIKDDSGQLEGLKYKGHFIPTGRDYRMLISYDHPSAFPQYSFSDVLSEEVPRERFENKIVLIGQTADGAKRFDIPSGMALSSVEVAANVLQNILKGKALSRPGWTFGLEAVVILYFGIFVSFVLPRVRTRMGLLMIALSLVPWCGMAVLLFFRSGVWLMAASPSVFLLFGYALSTARHYSRRRAAQEESFESNKELGLTFQGQGMFDLAFEKFMKCPVNDPSVKELLYNLGLDFERKRMPSKAVTVYQYIRRAGKFKDIDERIAGYEGAGLSAMFSPGGPKHDSTIALNGGGTFPTLGRYEVLEEIGRGAMGTVYRGRDPKINRDVAIKTLPFEGIEEGELGEVKKRFFQEAEAAGKLAHPNIMTIHDAGEEHDLAFIAMELLKGRTLSEHCSRESLLAVDEALRVVSAVATALDYAHQNGVVHRDIKPSNIMLLESGDVKVTDFGIARIVASSQTYTGMILGTPYYMSPEQVAGGSVEGPSDLFSLGIVFYELLVGDKPFQGESIAAVMHNISKGSYLPLRKAASRMPKCCEHIVEKLLSRSLRRRYKRGKVVVEDIEQCRKKIQ